MTYLILYKITGVNHTDLFHLLLIEDASKGLADVAEGRAKDARSALQRRRDARITR